MLHDFGSPLSHTHMISLGKVGPTVLCIVSSLIRYPLTAPQSVVRDAPLLVGAFT